MHAPETSCPASLHFMADSAAADPRSVAAQLRGRGDHRAARYLRFEQRLMRRDPALDLEQIADRYRAFCARSRRLARLAERLRGGIHGLARMLRTRPL